MPLFIFDGGFDFNTWGLPEYLVIGGAALALILIIVLIVLLTKKKVAKPFLYRADSDETLLFKGTNAWLSFADGKTELYRLVDGNSDKPEGILIYLVRDIKKVSVVTDGGEIKRYQSYEKQYITFEFVSPNEVKVGAKSFLTPKTIVSRQEASQVAEAKAKKEQDKADAKALKAQIKADKKLEAADRKLAKLAKKNKN